MTAIKYTFGSNSVIYCKIGLCHVLANLCKMYFIIHIMNNGQAQQEQLRGLHIHPTSVL